MNIKPYDKTIREILLSRRQFVIPRFQREYSWDQKNCQEFFDDIVGNLKIEKGKVMPEQYFLGTMLFVGNYSEGSDQEIQVVDGQQRLTTITILFSAISDRFIGIQEQTLSEQIFQYIMTRDDNGEEVRILQSKTHYPFFSYFIQQREKQYVEQPDAEEEILISETYKYLFERLDEKNIRSSLRKTHGSSLVKDIAYVDILKAIRDQVLMCTFVSISTTDKEQANKIFEILNAKGKKLSYVDLIKNKIFELLDETEPADFAEEKWKDIKNIINKTEENVGLAEFYRIFWIAFYKKSSKNKMYDDFLTVIPKTSKDAYKKFLLEMEKAAQIYVKIVNPKREDYGNRKEYYWLVQSLNVMNNYFNVTQVRIALLALFLAKEKDLIDLSTLKDTVLWLENFHFAYNAISSLRSSKFEGIYSRFALKMNKCNAKDEAKRIINDNLLHPLKSIFPKFSEFREKFVLLEYSKKDNPSNLKTKYAINKLNCLYEDKELFDDCGSIEHISSEMEGKEALSIGNLILLELNLNKEADNLDYGHKKKIYKKSQYVWMNVFLQKYERWNVEMCSERADQMAAMYYTRILKMPI